MISAVHTSQIFSGFRAAAIPHATSRVLDLVSKYFGILENVFFLSYGAKELLVDGILAKRKINPIDSKASWVEKAISKTKLLMAKVFQVHGELYIGSALAGTVVELHHLQLVNLGSLAPAFGLIGNGLFLYASFLSLSFHVDLYHKASEIEINGGEVKLVNSLKASAFMGILNSLGYVIAAITTIVGGSVTLALVFGCFALATGCIKVLYDYLVLSTRLCINKL